MEIIKCAECGMELRKRYGNDHPIFCTTCEASICPKCCNKLDKHRDDDFPGYDCSHCDFKIEGV